MQENIDANKSPEKKELGETISELAHRHLQDPNHKTTDEELRNARIELSTPPPTDDENLFEVDNSTVLPHLPGEDDQDDNKKESDHEGRSPNPYDLLNS